MVWGVQFHPEHAGGPEDTNGIFEDFVEEVVRIKGQQGRSEAGKGLPRGPASSRARPSSPSTSSASSARARLICRRLEKLFM